MIEFRGVGHTYRTLWGRRVRAVDDFTLSIPPGEIFGLAGPNGAGKSTLIAMLLGYLHPTDGALTIEGQLPRAYVERHGIGYLSELVNIEPRWTLETALERYALLAGLHDAELAPRIEQSIMRLGLDEHRGKKVRQLSKGNLQRLGLAQALLRDERILILDEPTHGLDPLWTQRFRDIVLSLRDPGRVIFIASHNLDELQRLADRVAIIDHGRLQRLVEPRAATTAGVVPYRIAVASGDALVAECFPDATPLGDAEHLVRGLDVAALNRAMADFIARGGVLRAVAPAISSLEQQFREAVANGRDERTDR